MDLEKAANELEAKMRAQEFGKSVGVLEEIRDALGRIELILKEKHSAQTQTL
jgi:hypothetical protein